MFFFYIYNCSLFSESLKSFEGGRYKVHEKSWCWKIVINQIRKHHSNNSDLFELSFDQ